MTEADWLEGSHLQAMLEFLDGKASDRKFRLYCCAIFREFSQGHSFLFGPQGPRAADLEAAERFAEGQATAFEVPGHAFVLGRVGDIDVAKAAMDMTREICHYVTRETPDEFYPRQLKSFCESHADVIRDIFGNPFRPVAFDPNTRTAKVEQIAKDIYEQLGAMEYWTFGQLAELEEAFVEAGCDLGDPIVEHCSAKRRHYRGCWLLDLVLSKDR